MADPGRKRRAPQFQLYGGALCLDFVNTLDNRPTDEPKELLASYADLARFGEDTGTLDPGRADRLTESSSASPEAARRALRSARELREAIYEVFSAVVQKRSVPAASLAALNAYVQGSAAHSRLVAGNRRFRWRFDDPGSDFNSILWPIAASAAGLLASDRLPLVRACSSETCQWLFLDTSKNHKRRWCSMRICGNRTKVRRFYTRRKKPTPA